MLHTAITIDIHAVIQSDDVFVGLWAGLQFVRLHCVVGRSTDGRTFIAADVDSAALTMSVQST